MKKIYFLSLMIITSYSLFGQVLDSDPEIQEKKMEKDNDDIQTLFSRDEKNGGYFDIYVNFSELNSKNAVEIGSRMAFIVKRSFAIGIDGAGFITDLHTDEYNTDYLLTGGYGGLLLEPIIFPKFPVHLSFPVVLGGGAVCYAEAVNIEGDVQDLIVNDVDGFLLAKPGVEIELNVTRYFRFCLNTHYRFTADLGTDPKMVSAKELDGFSYGISFKFGKF